VEIIRKIAVSILVLVISAAVFFMLIKEQNLKKDILRTTLELFGRELLARVPDTPQKTAMAKAINAYIDQAEQNNLPEEQIQKTVALGLNMSMSPQQLTPEELQAVFDIHADSAEIRIMRENRKGHPPMDRERLAHEINTMITFRRELADMEKNSKLDSLHSKLAKRFVFAVDSGLKVLIPTEFQAHGDRPLPPEWRDRLDKLERDKMMLTYDLKRLPPDLQKQQDKGGRHFQLMPPEVYAQVIMELRRNNINPDSLNLPAFLTNPDSLNAFLARIQKASPVRFQIN
jgi:hypothetical protein